MTLGYVAKACFNLHNGELQRLSKKRIWHSTMQTSQRNCRRFHAFVFQEYLK